MEAWGPSHVHTFMLEHGLGRHADTFLRHSINGQAMLVMDEKDLLELGMNPSEADAFRRVVDEQHVHSVEMMRTMQQTSSMTQEGVPTTDLRTWTPAQVGQWLSAIRLPHLKKRFADSSVDGRMYVFFGFLVLFLPFSFFPSSSFSPLSMFCHQ